MTNKKIFEAAFNVVSLLDTVADETLPQEIASVVKTHAKIALGSAVIPVPGLDIAGGIAATWGMYIRINGKINMSFSENYIKSLASGIGTNLAAYSVMLGIGSALKFIPGVGTAGGIAVVGVSLYALTLTSGYVYLKALEMLLKRKSEINEDQLKEAIGEVLGNKKEIKKFIAMAKSEYK